MEPTPSSGRRTSGSGGRGRAGILLGLKKASSPAPSQPPSSSPMLPSVPPPPTTFPAPPPSISAPAVPTSSASQASSSFVQSPHPAALRPPEVAGWGSRPNFPQDPWMYPPGGFMNFLHRPHYPQQPQLQGENFHLVGQPMSFNQISQSPPPCAHGTPQPLKQCTLTNETVNIDIDEDDNNGANRPVKKRYWSHEEEERLASAWLNASKDPIKGNDKKGDTFWKKVTEEFNKKGNGKRIRELNQLKVHWSRLKSSISDFNGYWTKVTQVHTSGYSDDMLEEEAQKMYVNKFGKRFLLVHWWKILKEEPKWCAQFEEQDKNKSEIVDIPDGQSHPIGREAAKAERGGKRKKENIMDGIVILGDNIEKIVKVQLEHKLEREKVTEAQIQISNANLKAATEQKEAKMFEVYNSLLNQDTSQMSENQKANRDRAIRKIKEKLFAD